MSASYNLDEHSRVSSLPNRGDHGTNVRIFTGHIPQTVKVQLVVLPGADEKSPMGVVKLPLSLDESRDVCEIRAVVLKHLHKKEKALECTDHRCVRLFGEYWNAEPSKVGLFIAAKSMIMH